MTEDLDTRADDARAALDRALHPSAPPLETLIGRRRRRRHVVTAAASLAIIAVVAAGLVLSAGGGDGRRTLSADQAGTWTRQVVSTAMAPDSPAPIATDQDTTVMVTVASDGTVTSYVASKNDPFKAGTPLQTGKAGLGLSGSALAYHDGAWFAVFQGTMSAHEVRDTSLVVRSSDGRSWKIVSAEGPRGISINAMTSTDDHLVAVGTSNPRLGSSQPSPVPVATWSADGRNWHTTGLPVPNGSRGVPVDATRVGGRVLAVGSAGDDAVLWRSDDGGQTWSVERLDAFSGDGTTAGIAATGDTVVISGSGSRLGQPVSVYSTDGGATWRAGEKTTVGDAGSEHSEVGPVVAGDGRFYRTRKNQAGPRTDPGRCYADPSSCTDSSVRLFTSTDGNHWREVDRSSARGKGADDADTVAVTGAGRVSTFAFTGDGFTVWSWPAGTPIPGRPPRSTPNPTAPVIDWRTMPEPGKRYARPVNLHCSAEFTTIGDKSWKLADDDSPLAQVTYGQTRMPESWPVAGQELLGYIELTAADTIAYSLEDGTVIGHYERYHGQVPGCM